MQLRSLKTMFICVLPRLCMYTTYSNGRELSLSIIKLPLMHSWAGSAIILLFFIVEVTFPCRHLRSFPFKSLMALKINEFFHHIAAIERCNCFNIMLHWQYAMIYVCHALALTATLDIQPVNDLRTLSGPMIEKESPNQWVQSRIYYLAEWPTIIASLLHGTERRSCTTYRVICAYFRFSFYLARPSVRFRRWFDDFPWP